MKRTPRGTPVGVDDPLEVVERCDWVTGDGRCRFAIEHAERNPLFAERRRRDDYRCPYADQDAVWADCEHFRSRDGRRRCTRCGLPARPIAHDPDARPLLEEHHVAYGEGGDGEVTVVLCRWCHARVHAGEARVDEDAEPATEALAALERRRDRERAETFRPAADRLEE
ncbi:MAG: hypothetical protein ACLFM8_09220 [Halobacteriales archaeon]